MRSSQAELARRIATEAHAGQLDKAGRPYIEHPAYVAAHVKGDEAKAVAWLHDVVEDTGLTIGDLRERGVCERVLEAVCAMTRSEGEDYFAYVERIKGNELARQVKLADLRHNSDLGRLPEVTEEDLRRREKYRRAIAALAS